MSIFSDRFNCLVNDRKLTNTSIAVALTENGCKVSDVTIGFWRKGKYEPTASNLSALASYFGVTTDYLLGRSDESLSDDRKQLIELAQSLPEDKVRAVLTVAKTIE